jgi:putative beta-lysine N-acetyltransferase
VIEKNHIYSLKENDKIEIFKGAKIQHGYFNDRVYLISLNDADPKDIAFSLIDFAKEKGYSKIFAKVKENSANPFYNALYEKEAEIPQYYNKTDTAVFLGYYLDEERKIEKDLVRYENVLKEAIKKGKSAANFQKSALPKGYNIRICNSKDAEKMAEIYKEVFPTYPFPIHDPQYLCNTMEENVVYYCVEHEDKIIALSSSEIDIAAKAAEMTDFATLPDFRGHSFSLHLLYKMEKDMKERGIFTLFTIARASSYSMNITFAKMGYTFSGRVINNTQISGNIESMNIWYKHLNY